MSDGIDLSQPVPDDAQSRARLLQAVLLWGCVGHRTPADDATYVELRRVMMRDPAVKPLLPAYVLKHRDLSHLWPYLKDVDPKGEPRRHHVRSTMSPLLDRLEATAAPAEATASDVLQGFEPAAVYALWQKALERRHTDPEGAIASARRLLETVCRHVLDERGITSSAILDLPALAKMTAEQLDVAPAHHAQAAVRRLLADAASAIEGLGSRRARPSARHAQLAVNMAGAAAFFIVESWEVRVEEDFLEMIDDSKGG